MLVSLVIMLILLLVQIVEFMYYTISAKYVKSNQTGNPLYIDAA